MNYEHLIVSETDAVLQVIVNRPDKRNALNQQVLAELKACFESHATRDDLVAATLEFSQSVEAIHNESNNAGSVRIAVAMTEGLHLLPSMLVRAVSGKVGAASVLRILTSNSGVIP